MAHFKYHKGLCDELIEHFEQGFSFASFAGEIGVHRRTLYDWMNEHPEFKLAKEIGEAKSLKFWEDKGLEAIRGRVDKFPQAVYIYIMKCRFRKFGYAEDQPFDEDDGDTDITREPKENLLRLVKPKASA